MGILAFFSKPKTATSHPVSTEMPANSPVAADKQPVQAVPLTVVQTTQTVQPHVPMAPSPVTAERGTGVTASPNQDATPAPTKPAAPFKITSLVAKAMRVEGNLTLTEGLKVEGEVYGNIHITGEESTLLLSAGATISGEVKVNRAIIAGTITGNLIAESVTILKTAKVDGDIFYHVLKIEDGGEINGKMTKNKDYAEFKNVHQINP